MTRVLASLLPASVAAGGRVRTPTVLQMEAVECGAACLAMVLGHYGSFVPLEDLRYACGIARDGTKASNIVKAAKRLGLKAKGFKMEPEGLRKLPLPLIAFWNFNHFVVVEGFARGKVFLNDPAAGPRAVDTVEFDECFTGVVLAFEPGPEFERGGSPPSWLAGLRHRLKGSHAAFLFIVLASLALVVPGLLVPAFSRVFVDYYLIEGLESWLAPLLLAMVAVALIRFSLTWLQQHNLLHLQTKLSLTSSAKFFWHVLRLPMGFFAQRFGGEIGSRVQINDRVAGLVAGELSIAVINMLTMVIYAFVMVQYDATLTAIGIGFAAINLLAFTLVSRRIADAYQRLLLDQGKLTGIAMQGLQIIESFKASGSESLFFSRWAGHHAKVVNAEQSLSRYRALLSAVPLFLGLLATTVILVIGGLRVMDGAITIGMLIAFQALMASFSAPVAGLVQLGSQLQEARGCLLRLDDVLGHRRAAEFRPPAIPAPAEPAPPPVGTAALLKLAGGLQAKGLSFGFIPTDPPLIDNFDLDLAPGARVAFVGGSGSGKSTLGKLIAGLYEPWAGEILLDGRPLAEVPRDVLRNSIALVDQDVALFEGTVSENITLWDSTIPEERIVQAAKDAVIHDEIAARQDGYEQKLEEGGRNLSGGQRQRLEIARALAANPSILVLDEATSALDATTEKAVVENLRRRGLTCIIIAHRLSTIRDCDEIVVLDMGKVVQRGTHAALKDVDGPYRRLIES